MMDINIITPYTRPENLQRIYESINFDFKSWWIVFDTTERDRTGEYNKLAMWFEDIPKVEVRFVSGGVWGNVQRNTSLNSIKDGFCYFLDDDNIIHPLMAKRLQEVHGIQNKKVYVFEQQVSPDQIKKIDIRRQHIDLAQYITHRSFFDERKFIPKHDADGFFIKYLWAKYKEDFCLIPEVLCYYNRLKWNA